jgi:ABC-2 type transport system ATP-binding protein
MDSEQPIIRAQGLSRVYRKRVKEEGLAGSVKALFRKREIKVEAVSDFDLEIKAGEIVGLIGPNGAGKTTLIKMLTGIIHPSSGDVSVLGHRPWERRESFQSRIALVMGQKSQLWWDLPAMDSFLLNKAIYGIPKDSFRATLDRLVGDFGVADLLDGPVRGLSLGERMKMEFIAAMLHGPDILFLDEPTIGLDAPSQRRIREFLARENRERGVTVILTSHYMEDIRRLCPRTVVVSRGRKSYDGDTQAMFAGASDHKLVRVTLGTEADYDPGLLPEAELLEGGPARFVLKVFSADLKRGLQALLGAYDVADIAVEEPEMAESVERIYGGKA